jgi:hypothetical protein
MIITEENPPDDIQEQKIIRYICKYEQCNSQSSTDSLINVVDKNFPLQPMRDALRLYYQQDPYQQSPSPILSAPGENLLASTSEPNVNQDISSNNAKTYFHISINLIFILFKFFFDI